MHKVTLNLTPEQVKVLKASGAYPYKRGGESFTEETVVYTDGLLRFAANPNCPHNTVTGKLVTDPYLKFEEVNEAPEETE